MSEPSAGLELYSKSSTRTGIERLLGRKSLSHSFPSLVHVSCAWLFLFAKFRPWTATILQEGDVRWASIVNAWYVLNLSRHVVAASLAVEEDVELGLKHLVIVWRNNKVDAVGDKPTQKS